MSAQQPEALRLADSLEICWGDIRLNQAADELRRLHSENQQLSDAARTNLENYEFQRRKADLATATVYQFHYAMKDAGWHPGRTDDLLTDIIRKKGDELRRLHAKYAELLDALQAFPGFTDDATTGDAWLEKMRAAIAKAIG